MSSLTPKIDAGLVWRLVDDSAVIVSPRLGQVHVLNSMATVIWQLLSEQHPIPHIVHHLATHYTVSEDEARRDLAHFLADLTGRGLLTD